MFDLWDVQERRWEVGVPEEGREPCLVVGAVAVGCCCTVTTTMWDSSNEANRLIQLLPVENDIVIPRSDRSCTAATIKKGRMENNTSQIKDENSLFAEAKNA